MSVYPLPPPPKNNCVLTYLEEVESVANENLDFLIAQLLVSYIEALKLWFYCSNHI